MHIAKPLLPVICLACTLYLQSQQIFISGAQGNRDLKWSDFTGPVDKSSPHSAHIHWNINYWYNSVRFQNDAAHLQGMSFRLDLDPDKSWVRHEHESALLLKHEQGHFDIARLCLRELKQTFDTAAFYKADFKTKVPAVFNDVLAKYNALSAKYDAETNHSKNHEVQKQWDLLLSTKLATSTNQ